MGYTFIFGTACIGLSLITVVWSALILYKRGQNTLPRLLGPAGTLSAAVPILGAWMPRTFQPLWIVVQFTFLVWLMSFVLIGLAVLFAFTLQTTRRDRITAIVCGGTGLLLNACAFLAFMWYATTSPGGV